MGTVDPDFVRIRKAILAGQLSVVTLIRRNLQHHLMSHDRQELYNVRLITAEQRDSGIRLSEDELEEIEIKLIHRVEAAQKLLNEFYTMSPEQLAINMALVFTRFQIRPD